MDDLKEPEGLLHPILDRVRMDHTLMLAVRDGYVNIYYRGGNILRLQQAGKQSYKASFDKNYMTRQKAIEGFPSTLKVARDVIAWIDAFPHLKEAMDLYFSKHSKPEREFQQLVARENNISTISNKSDYFVPDIECAGSVPGARFDMLAIRWPAGAQRKDGRNCRAALVEMKYGDDALDGKGGLIKHLKDFAALVSDGGKYAALLETMSSQFNQLDELGLLKFNHCKNGTKVRLNPKDKPEVIFILANHNPKSTKLGAILADPRVAEYEQQFNLRFFVSCFAGYDLHTDCMLTLTQFRRVLNTLRPKQRLSRR